MSTNKTLQKWMPEPTGPRRRNRVVIYDFDNTLVNTYGREEGEAAYFEGTGELWPFAGWYGRVETLLPPLVPDPIPLSLLIEDTVKAYRLDAAREDTEVVLMTGRPFKMRNRIHDILENFGISFQRSFFRGMKGIPQHGDTIDVKLAIIHQEIIHDSLEILEIWEDRPKHSSRFMTEAKRWKSLYRKHLEKVIIHDVPTKLKHEF